MSSTAADNRWKRASRTTVTVTFPSGARGGVERGAAIGYISRMAKVTGIGGVFFKSTNDHTALAAWYEKNLGIKLETWGGAILRWPDDQGPDKGLTVWHVAKKDTDWFAPSTSSFMINYRVDDMAGMLEQLKANGVEIVKGPDTEDNGVFAWVLDPDGNKIELWQPAKVH